MKILLLDIETAPTQAFVWGLWDQNVGLNQIVDSGYVLCWSAQWYGEREILFRSCLRSTQKMLAAVHKLLDEADVVVHYNGKRFDIPVLNREFAKHGMLPPAPYHQIDLMQVVKKQFRFESNKLEYVLQSLNLGGKVKHEGFTLWTKCMNRDPQAWAKMERYNRGDVRGLRKLYERLLPWIELHPSHGAHLDVECCPKCGSKHFQQRGFANTAVCRYRRYQCVGGCGGWFRGNKTVNEKSTGERMRNVITA